MAKYSGTNFLKNYGSILWMLAGIISGCILGLTAGNKISVIKPVGDIFLNLLFTTLIPVIFFTVSSSIANMDRSEKLGKLMVIMFAVFIITAIIAALCTIIGVSLFPVGEIKSGAALIKADTISKTWQQELVDIFTVSDVYKLFSKDNILALIIFAGLIGIATSHTGKNGKKFAVFLQSGAEIFGKVLAYIMKLAPIGIGAYFANQIGTMGIGLIKNYGRALAIFHVAGLFYYIVILGIYALIAGGTKAINSYRKNIITPSLTALGTCSSLATIPVNLEASYKMQVPAYIANIVIPLGGTIHKQGSSISAIIKIASVFALFHKPFSGMDVFAIAVLISVAVSFVEGGIPSGGYIGELLILSAYHFPAEAFPVVIILGTLVDPFATVLNVAGVSSCALLTSRIAEGKHWMKSNENILKNSF
ncbi:MAG: dicarboxylate/amino acid:cation symporter [Arachidicoccus sp.]|nr:dicarboxylate/amino acid:cation symporter [Arachidicoccus sp.]